MLDLKEQADIRLMVSETSAELTKSFSNKFGIVRLKLQELIQKVDGFNLDNYKEEFQETQKQLRELESKFQDNEKLINDQNILIELLTNTVKEFSVEVQMVKENISKITLLNADERSKAIKEAIEDAREDIKEDVLKNILSL